MHRQQKSRLVVISGLGGMAMACAGLGEPPCPDNIITDSACTVEAQTCEQDMPSNDPCDVRIHTCTDGTWERIPFPCNPPPPDTDPPEVNPSDTKPVDKEQGDAAALNGQQPIEDPTVCPDEIAGGEDCLSEGMRCMIPGNENGCGLQGHQCQNGKWDPIARYCNPPRQ